MSEEERLKFYYKLRVMFRVYSELFFCALKDFKEKYKDSLSNSGSLLEFNEIMERKSELDEIIDREFIKIIGIKYFFKFYQEEYHKMEQKIKKKLFKIDDFNKYDYIKSLMFETDKSIEEIAELIKERYFVGVSISDLRRISKTLRPDIH